MADPFDAIKNDPDFRALTPKQQARVLMIAEQARVPQRFLPFKEGQRPATEEEYQAYMSSTPSRKMLPALGATIGAMAGPPGWAGMAAATALGMGAGEAYRQIGDRAAGDPEAPQESADALQRILEAQGVGALLSLPPAAAGKLLRLIPGRARSAAALGAAKAVAKMALPRSMQAAAKAVEMLGAMRGGPGAMADAVPAAEAPVAQWLGAAPSTSAGNLRLVVPAARAAAPVAEAAPVAAAPMAAPVAAAPMAAEADPLLMQLRASLEAAKKPPLSRVPVAPPPPLQQTGDALFAKIVELRKTQGLSPAQIAKVVEEMSYQPGFKHLRPSEAKKMVEMVLQGID